MTDDKYNGWTNRETWALDMWLSNDRGLYDMTRERVAQAIAEYKEGYEEANGQKLSDVQPWVAGETVKALWEELIDPDEGLMSTESILEMVRDVGSEYRVNWDEIGAAWLTSLADDPIGDES